jgi:hypothetical protein
LCSRRRATAVKGSPNSASTWCASNSRDAAAGPTFRQC